MRGLHPAARDPLGVVGGHAGHDLGALTPALALGALGVVFGDIGTSPLYAIKACFHDGAFAPSETNILGVLSLVFWSLMLVVTLKYVLFIMRADHKGEGGLFALFNLLRKDGNHFSARSMKLIVLCTLAGAALFFGDGMITPAISVLSAVEGLGYATDVARPAVLPLTAAILVGLYALQRRGTGGIGRLFGPVMLTWFAAIALLGIGQIARAPEVLAALAPHHALDFLFRHGLSGFAVLGSVVLCITGCEALYADMGHFGAQPIRVSWFSVVLPALTLNYFGQGAGLLLDPAIASNPFYGIVPGALRIPMVLLASMATICASQAMISGVFSLARHAILLDYLPRMRVMRTSWIIPGQIYIPAINTIMMCASVLLVFAFRESANMAGAFGLAVTGTMVVTTCLYFFVITRNWKWPLWIAASLVSGFLILDLLFFGTNLLKVVSGGWFVLLAACAAMLCMLASKRHQDGNWRLTLSRGSIPLETFMRRLGEIALARAPGTAVFLGVEAANTPKSLVDILGERGVLHENVVIVCLRRTGDPTVEAGKRLAVRHLGLGVHQIVARYGFMEHPNVPELLDEAESHGVPHDPALVYYLGGQSRPKAGHGPWENVLDAVGGLLFRGEPPAFTSFGIPAARVITEAGDVE
ncbi:potassium transporter Kup [Fundidesulfovibrio magnetotacticus]|nr:KUP/HAK/KT family potassium transporter [Fundidesulfovibrio magnetotacticus]